MTDVPFEDPEKTSLRERVAIAIDAAGFEVAVPVTAELPAGSNLRGGIRGDVQGIGSTGVRTHYYLRTNATAALPKWVANIAALSHQVPDQAVYVVVPADASDRLVASCRTAGAGLLTLAQDRDVFLTTLDYSDLQPVDPNKQLQARATKVRRSLELKVGLMQDDLRLRHQTVLENTGDMSPNRKATYVKKIELAYQELDSWSEQESAELDAVEADLSLEGIAAAERRVNTGPSLALFAS